MKTIYVKNNILKEAVDYLNDDITFFGFLSHLKVFLKQLLTTPINADIDEYLKKNGLNRKELIEKLIERNIIVKETKIEDNDGKDKFYVSYKIPKRNFERKIRRLYMTLFEKNEINENDIIKETDCGGVMQGGGSNPDAGQFIQPLGKPQRRKIYITTEQSNFIQETTTHDTGNYQYDVPLNFNNGNDPAFDHSNIMAKSFPNKKKGIRKKVK